MNTFLNIAEYISGFSDDRKIILEDLYKIIKKHVPKETVEKISYGMPTFYYNGNLIHFALFKNHLGLYPGPDAIEVFQDQLTSFKTSKGAIQLPLDQKLPKQLIADIIAFNVSKLKDKKAANWSAYNDKWTDAEEFMQQLIVKTNLDKAIKWDKEVYTFNNKNVIGWGGFKDFFSLWFYNGVFLSDPEKVLVNASDGKTKAMRQWRFTNVADMDEKKILAYINESIQTIKDGKEIRTDVFEEKKPEGIFKDFLESNIDVKIAFEKLTKGKQKEYVVYIDEAKQEKTKATRLEKIKELILQNKGLNDKYKTK
ncbi:Uncharacterized conserved protein YdeI, YjbR/CyaY-like superfamily, DUF1801 family [Paenimyroides ummariense]|uniref:Uncharacterized conserved protein YdeI, YjbR/CyaY-like superfamily, DUF1801 family n=1 Tax=Paenimyroides ummariense TaxID=913024 RepID=A0A1I5D9T0_9FLAO|nr:DUF1801 domain-containing protein [Paenimyroides ummariense]SFN95953.1 Uncharacterized conserved protein YdeI, YjbR/CyaY-like superfamily, DUF1801 family [Paenimyroides ummariense]